MYIGVHTYVYNIVDPNSKGGFPIVFCTEFIANSSEKHMYYTHIHMYSIRP